MGLLSNILVWRFLSTIPLPLPSMVQSQFLLVHQSWVATGASGGPTSSLSSFRHRNFVRKDLDWKGHDLDPSPPHPYRECTPRTLGILPPFSLSDLVRPSFLGRDAGSQPQEGNGRAFGDPFSQGSIRLFEAIVGAPRSTCRRALLHVCAHVAFARALQRRRVRLQGRRNVQTKLENLVRPFAWTETCPRRRTKRGKPTTKQPSRDTWCNERGLRLEQQAKGG